MFHNGALILWTFFGQTAQTLQKKLFISSIHCVYVQSPLGQTLFLESYDFFLKLQ